MKRHLRLIALALLLIAIPLLKVGCGGATPPAPPLEIPSPLVLKFVQYEDIKIDFSQITSADAQASLSRQVGFGVYSDLIEIGPAIVEGTGENIANFLSLLDSLEIPVGEEVTTFEGTMTSVGDDGSETSYAAKLDFADFDLDGVNGTEGCSGHTAALPVCVRLWRDGKRFFAWVFDAYPFPATADSPANPGKSRFRLTSKELSARLAFIAASIAFDHVDPTQLITETFLYNYDVADDGLFNTEEEGIRKTHLLTSQSGAEGESLKVINLDDTTVIPEGPLEGEFSQQYLAQYLEGEDFWSGSIFDSTGETPEVENLCARISTADETAQSHCDLLGISVAGIDFVRPLEEADVIFYDFPEEPTF